MVTDAAIAKARARWYLSMVLAIVAGAACEIWAYYVLPLNLTIPVTAPVVVLLAARSFYMFMLLERLKAARDA
jgi:hypothetical protein